MKGGERVEAGMGGRLGLLGWLFALCLYHSFCFSLKIELGLAEEEGSTQLGYPSTLTRVMVLHTGD